MAKLCSGNSTKLLVREGNILEILGLMVGVKRCKEGLVGNEKLFCAQLKTSHESATFKWPLL